MSRIVVLGGGLVGLCTAMMLAREGHDVTVLEQDGEPAPASVEEAWQRWERRGVAQFRQPHYLQSAGRRILDDRLPDVTAAMLRAGCITFDLATLMPPSITDRAPREGDERFVTITGRRPALEYAVASVAERCVPIVRGVSVSGLLTRTSATNGIPHVTGVRTTDGREFAADLVIDAMGRRSKLPELLQAVGARAPFEEAEESGFMYYTRFFRANGAGVPQFRAGLMTNYHCFTLLTLPGDSDTWSTTIFIFSGDPALKALRDPGRWAAVVASCPLHAQWLDGEPTTDILPMGGVTDRYRSLLVDGEPVATGVLSVGDAQACTNPVGGRGISMGLIHAVGTLEVIHEHLDDPSALARAHDAMTQQRVKPWYRYTVEFDRQRNAQIKAFIEGQEVPRFDSPATALASAMMHDADLFRAWIEIQSLLAQPEEVLSRPGIVDRITAVAAGNAAAQPPCPPREALLSIVA